MIWQIPEGAIELIKRWEGFSGKPYICPAGHLTIGYGTIYTKEIAVKFGLPLSEKYAEQLLTAELNSINLTLRKLIADGIYRELTEGRLSALLSFSYNLGTGAFQRSTLRSKLNRGEYEDAADEFLRWVYAGGKPLRGLLYRRMEERRIFLNG